MYTAKGNISTEQVQYSDIGQRTEESWRWHECIYDVQSCYKGVCIYLKFMVCICFFLNGRTRKLLQIWLSSSNHL